MVCIVEYFVIFIYLFSILFFSTNPIRQLANLPFMLFSPQPCPVHLASNMRFRKSTCWLGPSSVNFPCDTTNQPTHMRAPMPYNQPHKHHRTRRTFSPPPSSFFSLSFFLLFFSPFKVALETQAGRLVFSLSSYLAFFVTILMASRSVHRDASACEKETGD